VTVYINKYKKINKTWSPTKQTGIKKTSIFNKIMSNEYLFFLIWIQWNSLTMFYMNITAISWISCTASNYFLPSSNFSYLDTDNLYSYEADFFNGFSKIRKGDI